jgi:hypothetical protein
VYYNFDVKKTACWTRNKHVKKYGYLPLHDGKHFLADVFDKQVLLGLVWSISFKKPIPQDGFDPKSYV